MAEIINLAEVREKRGAQSAPPLLVDQADNQCLLLLREIVRDLGLMPYEAWVAAGRPEGR